MMRALVQRFLRLYAAASLKPAYRLQVDAGEDPFSAALCRSLIEATGEVRRVTRYEVSFLRLYAAASLKPCTRIWKIGLALPVFCGFMPQPH